MLSTGLPASTCAWYERPGDPSGRLAWVAVAAVDPVERAIGGVESGFLIFTVGLGVSQRS
jgi:hypothetical protein